MNALARLHRDVRACARCVAAGHLKSAKPIVAGTLADRVMIVGQAPGIVETEVNAPFSGRSGVTLRSWLAEAGISEDELPYRTSVTKCFPGKVPGGAGDRRPSPAEIDLCSPFLERELDLVRPDVMVLLGQMAIERYWGKAPLHEAVGRSRRLERVTKNGDAWSATLIPLPHPSGASRWLNDPANKALLRMGLGLLRREAQGLRRSGGIRRAAS